MKWYEKYLSTYEKAYDVVPLGIIDEIKNKINGLQSDNPLASVVIIAYNEEKHLVSNLWSLSDSKCKYPIEIIGVDNDSSDKTANIYTDLNIPYFTEYKRSCGYARQCGLQHARGKYYICIDADTMYPPHYIETMIAKLQNPKISCVSSLWSYIPDKQHSWLSLKLYEKSRDIYLYLQSFKRPELSVRGLVFAYKTEYGRQVGFRVNIKRGEDGSMALGLKNYGQIAFLYNHKARAITGCRSLSADGTIFNSFKNRLVKALKNGKNLFTNQTQYKDDDSNLIK